MSVSDTISTPKIATGNVSGPASYATTGFLLDLSATFSYLHHLDLVVETAGSLPPVEWEIELNRDLSAAFAPGKAVINLIRLRYDKGSVGNAQSAPGGVTIQASKTATGTTTGSSHTHAIDHDHPSATSGAPTAGGEGVNAAAAQPAIAGHTHTVDIASFTGASGAATHTHDRSFEYEHAHPVTGAETNATATEVASSTNLSGTTWRYCAVGH